MPTLRADSTVYLKGTITVDHDITGKTVEVAIPSAGVAPDTWQAATVLSVVETPASSGTWVATYRMLIGPLAGVYAPPVGQYDWTLRITDTPERPVIKAGTLKIVETG